MGKKVFISYSHAQGQWVFDRLVPCLRAGGAEVLIDQERFTAGKAVVGQMDAVQDTAEMSVLVFSPEYLQSDYCLHEMDKAVSRDPQFHHGSVIPVKRVACDLPDSFKAAEPLYVNLLEDRDVQQWDALLHPCDANLGASAPEWLSARDEIRRLLKRNQSVNLVVTGSPQWRKLIEHLWDEHLQDLVVVDLDRGATAPRRGLVAEILIACGAPTQVPEEPEDLVVLDRILSARPLSRVALAHFDIVTKRPSYNVDFFAALRYLIMESRKLVVLVQSRTPFLALLPPEHPLSSINLVTVELKGRP